MSLFGKGPSQKKQSPFLEEEESSERVTTTEGVEDSPDNVLQNLFSYGSQNQPFEATDFSDMYAQHKGYFLKFTHLPSGLTLSFKGFITNLQDNFSSNWTSTSVYGRMDDIQTFQNTTRQMSVGFVVPAFDADDARCNLAKVSSLMRKLYPHYSGGSSDDASTLSRSPLMRIRFANLIRNGGAGGGGLLGKVSGFNFEPNLDHGFYDYTNVLYPKTINVGFTFDVLHEHVMGWTDVENANGDVTGVTWADGQGRSFPYALPRINEELDILESEVPEEEATSEDDKANLNQVLFNR